MKNKKLETLKDLLSKKHTILAAIFLIALFSRVYCLNSFPYFPQSYPWVGAGASPPLDALYTDEHVYYTIATGTNNSVQSAVYQPWLQLFLINASVSLFGTSGFAVRLPSALMSTLSVVLVYLICTKKFGNRLAAFLSPLYLIVMMPALVLNRMAFLENGVMLFFLASYFCLLQYSDPRQKRKERWLLGAAVFAGLSVLSKIVGLVTLLFFTLYLVRAKSFIKNLKFVALAVGIAAIFPIAALLMYNFDVAGLLNQLVSQWSISGGGLPIWKLFSLNIMPSGHITQFGGHAMLEFWYLFAIFSLVYLAVTELHKASDTVLALFSFVGLFFVVNGATQILLGQSIPIGAYYLIAIQPFLCIPVGYALTKSIRGSALTTLFFPLLLYTPMVLNMGIYLVEGLALFAWTLTTVGAPLFLLITQVLYKDKFPERFRVRFNMTLLIVFFAFLVAGSYLLPVFYPNYFVGP